jgi:hypothetical protein
MRKKDWLLCLLLGTIYILVIFNMHIGVFITLLFIPFVWELLNPAIPPIITVVLLGYIFNLWWYNGRSVPKNGSKLFFFLLASYLLIIHLVFLVFSFGPDPKWDFHF